ncbi:hypothetical protein TKK_0005670 [Trichogramma kaykai]|uniref:Uncharacterized protein n=1 Tax=Trichogramma kaykai TaxID=54128 RepID=A0ABD2XHM0_9HYME
MSQDDRQCVRRLVSLIGEIAWGWVGRHQPEFFRRFEELCGNWQGPYPDLKDLFSSLQVEFLVYDALYLRDEVAPTRCLGDKFIEFVAASNYQIVEPAIDTDRMKLPSTAVHLLVKRQQRTETRMDYHRELFQDLFIIYHPRVVDSDGSTLLHAICRLKNDSYRITRLFFRINKIRGRTVDVDARDKRGDTALHVAVAAGNKRTAEVLLEEGADPNLANELRSTPLHVILARNREEDDESGLLRTFLETAEDVGRRVDVNARDDYGRMPLQYALSYIMPNTASLILTRNVDMARFSFPESFATGDDDCKLRQVSGILRCVETLERKGGYLLRQNDAQSILRFFAADEFFKKLRRLNGEKWFEDPIFMGEAENVWLGECTLLDLIFMKPAAAERKYSPDKYWMISELRLLNRLPEAFLEPSILFLCKVMARGFFRRLMLLCWKNSIPDALRRPQPDLDGIREDLLHICT